MRLKIALRNVFRNGRRTALNIFMIASGVCGIILFKGYSHNILFKLKESTIRSQTGHLQIATPGFWEHHYDSPKDVLVPGYRDIQKRIAAIPQVSSVAGRIEFFGLMSFRERTQAVRGMSFDIVSESARVKALRIQEGNPLSGPHQILAGAGLARQLGLKPGDSVTVLGYTYDGVVNALDMDVAGSFQSGVSEVDNSTFIIPLASAQRLLDTESVERIVVEIRETDDLPWVQKTVAAGLEGTKLELRNWLDLSLLYRQVEEFYQVYNRLIEAIILALVTIGILNTLGMAVFERTGEIGTLRALGEPDGSIIRQFLLEGLVLGVFGGVLGVALAAISRQLIHAADFRLVLPNASVKVPVQIDFLAWVVAEALGLTMLSALVASFFPSLRATRVPVVEALKRNI